MIQKPRKTRERSNVSVKSRCTLPLQHCDHNKHFWNDLKAQFSWLLCKDFVYCMDVIGWITKPNDWCCELVINGPKLERNVRFCFLFLPSKIGSFSIKEAHISALCTGKSAVLLYDFSTILYWVFFKKNVMLAHEPTYPIISTMIMLHL